MCAKSWPNPRDVPRVPYKDQKIDAYICGVHDGDTCTAIIPFGEEYLKVNIRLMGIDTPELKGEQVNAGIKVRDIVTLLILNKSCKIKLVKWDKYGSRINGDVYLDDVALSQYLLDKKYALPYDGGKKREWTKEELDFILSC